MALRNKKFCCLLTALLAAALLLAACGEVQETVPTQTDATQATDATQQTTRPTEPAETLPPAVWETTPKLGATYEQWLAAAMYLVMPLEYPDFQLVGMYAASHTELAERSGSAGVYFCFLSGGEEIWIHSVPLAANRSEKGARDLHTAQIGYASLDVVEPVDTSAMTQLQLEDLVEPMKYTVLPGLIQN